MSRQQDMATGYLLDAVTGAIGGRARWRTLPWMVIGFGLAVGPLGAVSILLVILQPMLFDAWCTLCLASAAISPAMIGPALDEVLASLQHLQRVRWSGGSGWRAFWGLATEAPATPTRRVHDARRRGEGMGIRIASVVLGLWLMVAPAVLGYGDPARMNHRIVGPIVASVAFIAMWEVARGLRRANAGAAAWLLVAPWILRNEGPIAALNGIIVDALLLALVAIRGRVRQRFGGGWGALVREARGAARASR